MDRKARFNVLREDLRYPLPDLAHHLKLPFATIKAYASESRPGVIPSDDVLHEMEALLIDQAIVRIRAAGLEVIPGKRQRKASACSHPLNGPDIKPGPFPFGLRSPSTTYLGTSAFRPSTSAAQFVLHCTTIRSRTGRNLVVYLAMSSDHRFDAPTIPCSSHYSGIWNRRSAIVHSDDGEDKMGISLWDVPDGFVDAPIVQDRHLESVVLVLFKGTSPQSFLLIEG